MQFSEISDCLEKLFIFQDKPISENKKAILTQEIIDLGFPYVAIVQGLKSLYQQDIRTLKLAVIIDAIKKFIDINLGRHECCSCNSNGAIISKDDEGRWYAMACKCSNGDLTYKFQNLVKWNGMDVQFSNGRNLTI
jgi:hypothetical protein